MSMQALNKLVARSITDETVLRSFQAGRIADVLSELEFTPEMRADLAGLQAHTFAEFAVLAYRTVRAAEEVAPRIQLPSPLEGLVDNHRDDEEQVA